MLRVVSLGLLLAANGCRHEGTKAHKGKEF